MMEPRQREKVVAGLDLAARWLLALVFLAAGLPKVFDPRAFAEIVGAYGMLVPELVMPVAVVLPLLEVVAALLLILGRRSGLYLSALLLLLFIGVLSYGIVLGLDIDCGCFGPEDPEHQAFNGLRTALLRDIALLPVLAVSLYHSFSHPSREGGERR